MASTVGSRPLFPAMITSLIVAGLSYVALDNFAPAQIIPCMDTWADHLVLAVTFALVLQMSLAPRILPERYKFFLAVHAALILTGLWLGLYSISPLGYSSGRLTNLRGFLITTANRRFVIGDNEIVSLQRGIPVQISPLTLAGRFHCAWMSSADGALDDPSSCELVYMPTAADHDILRIQVKSGCGLPDSTGHIKVAILP
jgi:hypothetical protein